MLHIVRPTLMYPFFGTIRSEVNCYWIFHLHGTQLVQLVTIVTGWHWFIFIETRLLCNNNRFADYGNALKPSSLEDSHWSLREKTHATCWWSFGFHTLQELPIKHTIKLPQSEDGVENRTRPAPGQYRNEWNIKLSASVGGRTTRRDATAGKSNNPPREAPFARFRNVCKFPARERATLLNWEQSR